MGYRLPCAGQGGYSFVVGVIGVWLAVGVGAVRVREVGEDVDSVAAVEGFGEVGEDEEVGGGEAGRDAEELGVGHGAVFAVAHFEDGLDVLGKVVREGGAEGGEGKVAGVIVGDGGEGAGSFKRVEWGGGGSGGLLGRRKLRARMKRMAINAMRTRRLFSPC